MFIATGEGQRTNVNTTSIDAECSNVARMLISTYGSGVNVTQPWTCTFLAFNEINVRAGCRVLVAPWVH